MSHLTANVSFTLDTNIKLVSESTYIDETAFGRLNEM